MRDERRTPLTGPRRLLVAAAVMCAVLFGASPAWAGVGFAVFPNVPSPLTVGQSGVPSTLTITNNSNGAEASLNVTLGTITLVPTCGTQMIFSADCPMAAVDPGVVRVSATGTGQAGSACAGDTFTTTLIDASQDKYQLAPSSPVVLGPAGAATDKCVIDFTVAVIKAPTKDANPGVPNVQTEQIGFAGGVATDGLGGFGSGRNEVTVRPGTLPVATQVAPTPITLGSSFHDTATLTPAGGAAILTGTVTFNVYGPGDPTCATVPAFTSTNAVNAAGTTAGSANFNPVAAGTYRVIATYSGDANYNPAASSCADPAEAVVVNKAPLPIATAVAATPITLGSSFSDTATLGPKPAGPPAPTGTVTFNVYGPGDPPCTAAPVFTSTNALNAAGTSATSSTFAPTTTGTYRVIATYSGDANYTGSASLCADPAEAVVVNKAPLPIATAVAPTPITIGSSFHDTATLGPAPAGAPASTGTVTFNVYGPADATCSAAPAFASTSALNAAGTTATSGSFTPTTTGTYRVIASYSGDANYIPVVRHCGDHNESVTVVPDEAPTAAYTASTSHAQVGQTVAFDGTGSSDPDGAITIYRWVWGDGTPDGSGATATHVFTTTGVHSVGLYVTDQDGQTASVGHGITVVDELPTVAYTPSTYSPGVGQTDTFTATASDPDGNLLTYRWVWGDGTPDGNGATATHAFATTGLRSVGLYVTDSDAQTAAVGHGITALADELPSAAFTPSAYTPVTGQTVSFTASASDPDGTIAGYRWVWGDGTPDGSGPTPTHVFASTGRVTVALYVTDSDGNIGVAGHSITTGDEPPTAAYTPSTFTPAVGQTVTFTGSGTDPDGTIVIYRWVWGDGTPDGSGPTATHAFTTTGVHSVALYVTDSDGSVGAVGHSITVSGGAGA